MSKSKWFAVAISGRIDDRPRDVSATLRALDEMWAAYQAVAEEWPDYAVDHDYSHAPGRRVIRFLLEDGDERRIFRTEHETFAEMAREVTGAAEIARLDGHPVLPLAMDAEAADAG